MIKSPIAFWAMVLDYIINTKNKYKFSNILILLKIVEGVNK